MDEELRKKIDDIINSNKVVLFMKGTALEPMCGFSSQVVSVLLELGVEFMDINVLEDEELRQGIKEYSDWPTIPQLYINQKFVGGCDITLELFKSGELQKLLDE